jgi:polyhydroxyalkanoate synthesis regulator phasin
MYTIGTAAKATGKAKSVISRDIHKGKISATKNEDGTYSIDPAELHRVYPPVSESNGSSNGHWNDSQPLNSPSGTGGLAVELQHLRERLSSLEAERHREREQLADQIDDLRRRLDRADDERRDKDRQLTALLTHERTETEAPGPNAGRGFWGRLRRKA